MNLEDHDQSHWDVETTGARKVRVEASAEPPPWPPLAPSLESLLQSSLEVPDPRQAQQSLAVGQRRSALRIEAPSMISAARCSLRCRVNSCPARGIARRVGGTPDEASTMARVGHIHLRAPSDVAADARTEQHANVAGWYQPRRPRACSNAPDNPTMAAFVDHIRGVTSTWIVTGGGGVRWRSLQVRLHGCNEGRGGTEGGDLSLCT